MGFAVTGGSPPPAHPAPIANLETEKAAAQGGTDDTLGAEGLAVQEALAATEALLPPAARAREEPLEGAVTKSTRAD